ncbi:MAG: MBL fold metallo-hydrolase [Planctomycetota bacterium]
MNIVMLGTGGYHPSDLRQTACFMIPEEGILLDAGTAIFRARDYIQTNELDILLSHAHLDHVIGLTYLFDVLYKQSVERVTAYIEEPKIKPLETHLFADELFPIKPPFEFAPIESLTTVGKSNCKLTTFPLPHPGGSRGFRLDWPDRSLAYVTDTVADPDAEYTDIISGVDILIHECYFADGADEYATLTGHSWASQVAKVAVKSKVGQLILVHVNPVLNVDDPIGLDTVEKAFPNTILGRDNMTIEF